MSSVTRRGSRWQASIVVGGRRYRHSFRDASEAQLWVRQAELDAARGAQPSPPVASAGHPVTLEALHTATHAARWCSGRTAYMSELASRVVADLGPSRDPRSVSYADLVAYVDLMRLRGFSHSTINKRLSAASAMLREAQRRGWIQRMPQVPYQKVPPSEGRWLTDDEQALVVAELRRRGDERTAGLVVFLAETGMRLSEALGLPWRDLRAGAAFVHAERNKTGRPRQVPLTVGAREVVDGIERTGAGPFVGMARDAVSRRFRAAADAVGLPDAVVHSLRHTCASRLVMAGVDIRRVRDWMGHSSIQTTMRYAHLAPQSLMDVVGLVERRSRVGGVPESVPRVS